MGGTTRTPKSLTPLRPATAAQEQSGWVYYHGTPDERTWEHSASRGLHVGTYEAARQALEATIGAPAEGEWDGTREYGRTPIVSNAKNIGYHSGLSYRDDGQPMHEHARYGDGTPVPLDARPGIFPVRITGPMTNHPATPMEDAQANGRMKAQITRGQARRGYFYRNVAEDGGSISAVLPSPAHVERVHLPKEAAHETSYGWDDDETYNLNHPENEIDAPSASEEYWNPPKLYHGTSVELNPGDMAEGGHPSNFDKPKGRLPHAYATPHVSTAAGYAETAAQRRGGVPRVYEVDRAHDMLPDPETGAAFGISSETLKQPDWRSKSGFRVLRELHPSEFEHHLTENWPGLGEHTASRWTPQAGIFGPTTGLDPLLFDENGNLRPQVRHDIMTRLDQCVRVDSGLAGSDWQTWMRVYLTGGSASEWAGSRPNETARDLDVIVAIDLAGAQGHNAFEGMNGGQAASALNAAFWKRFNADGWQPEFGGTWNLTAFCNQRAQDGIAAIKPYAAWDLTDSRWAVRPPHLPEHTVADFDPAVVAHARAVAAEARAVLRMAEPLRTREARDLWEHIRAHRCTAFSEEGTGWDDPGNVDEKMLAYAPRHLLDRVKELALAPRTAAAGGYLRNPYHGNPEVGGRDDWSQTWFHGTKGASPDMTSGRPAEPERGPGQGWPQANKFLGTHFSPLHSVAHNFAHGVYPFKKPGEKGHLPGIPSALVHARLKFRNPAHFPTENHLNIAMAQWASRYYPGWHDDKVNSTLGWNYSDQEGTHRDWSTPVPTGDADQDSRNLQRLSRQAESVFSWHPRTPEIAHGFTQHLIDSGHHGITYGNQVEGPGGFSMPAGQPKSFSAIATRPDQIEPFGTERIAAPRTAPQPGEVTHEQSGELNEPGDFDERVTGYHSRHQGDLPFRLAVSEEGKTAAWDSSGSDHSGVYLRFGDWPHDERSFSPAGGYHEEGVSAYDLDREGDPAIDHGLDRGHVHEPGYCDVDEDGRCQNEPDEEPDNDPHEEMQGRVAKAERNRRYGSDRPSETAHLVRGEMSGVGYDGEPLLKNVKRVGDWIDHRHLFIDTAGSHRLARDPSDEDYEEPEEKPPYGYRNQHTAAAQNPPCRYCEEPLDDEDVRDGHSAHEECSDMRWCEPHQDCHDDPAEAEGHNDTYTEWGSYLPFEGGMHRGITVRLPGGVHRTVHDSFLPASERARALKRHLDEGGHYGVHWTDHLPIAQAWGSGEGALFSGVDPGDSGHTHVVIHAASPAEEHIEDDPEKLAERNMWGFGHDRSEREIPLKEDAPVHVTGISWKRGGQGEWNRHDFGSAPRTAALEDRDYWISHRPPGPGATHLDGSLKERWESLPYHQVTSRDPEEPVDVYRSAPKNKTSINPGDWVTTHKDWAQERAESMGPDHHVIHARVPARHVYLDASERDDDEAGYHGPAITATASWDDEDEDEDEDPDRYVYCDQGHEHWGAKGAAGLLVRHDGKYLLQKRSPYVQHGSTWSTPGGALQHGESPEEGAVREAGEEGMRLPAGTVHHHTFTDDHGGWAYHTVVMDAPHEFSPSGRENWESEGHGWFTPGEMRKLPLHPGFAASWDKVRKSAVTARKTAAGNHGDWTAAEPHRAAVGIAQEKIRRDYPELSRPLGESRTAVLRQMLGRASFALPKETIDSAWAAIHPHPEHGVSQPAVNAQGHIGAVLHPDRDDALTLGHEAGHIITIKRNEVEENRKRDSWEPRPSEMDPDERDHGHAFAWNYALALDGAGHSGAAGDFRRHYTDAVTEVADRRHARGLSRDFPGSGLSPHPPPDLSHLPPMPQSQQHAVGAGPRALLDVAKNPEPGTRIWRGERRDAGEDPASPSSVGIHWSVHPANVITQRYNRDEGTRPVVWQGRLARPAEQAIPRSHPMWSGRHMSMDSEAEVRLRPHAAVHVEGAWVGEPGDGHGEVYPLNPARNGPGWTWHPVGRDVPVRYSGNGETDYSDVGIQREAAEDTSYRQPHQGPDAEDGEALHELGKGLFPADVYDRPHDYGGDPATWQKMRDARGDPERKVMMYRAMPAPHHKINTGDWVTLSKDYALQHAQENDGDHYAVLKQRVRAGDLRNDGNDLHEWTYHGPTLHLPGLEYRGGGGNGWKNQRDLTRAQESDMPQEWKDEDARRGREDRAEESRRRKIDSSSGMVYLHVPPGTIRAPQGGEAHHHVTLAYLPKGMSDEDFEAVSRHVQETAARHAPFKGTFGGGGTFPEGADRFQKRTAYVPLHAPGAERLHADLSHLSRAKYESFAPHATTAYLRPGDATPEAHPEVSVPFTHLHVRRGDEVRSFPLTGPSTHEAASGYTGLTKRSGMIYLDLPPGTVRQVPGGVDDHHVTLVYLGKDVSDAAFAEACRRTRAAAAKLAPMDGVLRGIDIFPPSKSSDGKVVAFVPAYIGGVGALRRELEDLSASEHTDYRPHVTLAYLEEGDSLPAPHPAVPLRFTSVHVERGDDIRSFPLLGGIKREAKKLAWYHGTAHEFQPGDLVDPEYARAVQKEARPGHVYFTHSLGMATDFADLAQKKHSNEFGEYPAAHVYEIEPTGDYEEDPDDSRSAWTSRSPLKVIRHVMSKESWEPWPRR